MQDAAAIMSDALTAPGRSDIARRLLEDYLTPTIEGRQDALSLTLRHHELLRILKLNLKTGMTLKELVEGTSAKVHPHGEAVVAALCQRLLDEQLIRMVKLLAGRRYFLTAKGSHHLATLAKGNGAGSSKSHGRRARITETLKIGTGALKQIISKALAENSPELLGPAEIAEKMGLDRSEGTGTIRTLLQELVVSGEAEWVELRPGCGVYKASKTLVAASGVEDVSPVSTIAATVLGVLSASTRPVEVAVLALDLGLPKTALRLPMFELKQGGYAVRKRRRGVVSYAATDLGREIAAAT